MKRLGALAALLLAGCASAQTPAPPAPAENSLQQIAAADLEAAIAGAKAENDQVGLACWLALQSALPTINRPLAEVKGVASAIEAKRQVKSRIAAGIPPAVVSGCANLYVEEKVGVMKDLMLFLGLVR